MAEHILYANAQYLSNQCSISNHSEAKRQSMIRPENILLFICHEFVEWRVFLRRAASWMHVSIFLRIIGLIAGIPIDTLDFIILCIPFWMWRVFKVFPIFDRGCFARFFSWRISPRVSRPVDWSSEVEFFLRTFVVPWGRTARVLAVKVSNCLARKPTNLYYSSDLFSYAEILFLNFSSVAAFTLALKAEMFAAGVLRFLSAPPSPRACRLVWSSVDISYRAFAPES